MNADNIIRWVYNWVPSIIQKSMPSMQELRDKKHH